MKITRAVHHIPLSFSNPGKLAKLDALAAAYLALVQQYVTHFCTETLPAKFAQPCFESDMSERWQREQRFSTPQGWRNPGRRTGPTPSKTTWMNARSTKKATLKAKPSPPGKTGTSRS